MRISDWSSDVCSSDLSCPLVIGQPIGAYNRVLNRLRAMLAGNGRDTRHEVTSAPEAAVLKQPHEINPRLDKDRQSVVTGKSVSVRVDIGGRRILKTKNTPAQTAPSETSA